MRFILLLFLLISSLAAADWPNWRGPNGDGTADGDPPVEFSTEKNVDWKVEIPGRGFSTPIVYDGRVYLTTAIQIGEAHAPAPGTPLGSRGSGGAGLAKHEFVVMALDLATGKTIWQRTATTAEPHQGYHRTYGSHASNSPVTDGETLFVSFGSRGVYAYDFDGELKWKTDLPIRLNMRNSFGEGSAPVVAGDTLLLNCDQEEQSYLLALDKRTGKDRWRAMHDGLSTWAPPFVTEVDGRMQVITPGETTRAHDLKNGSVIWSAKGLGTNAIPTPLRQDDFVLVMTGHRNPNLMAVRLGEEGDLTGSDAVLWTNQRGNAYTPSPVLHEGIYYVLSDRGFLSAFDARTGETFYRQQRLPDFGAFKASPVAAAGRLYLAGENGVVTVVKLGKAFEVLARNPMGQDERFISSPVVVGDRMLLRGERTLYAVGR